MASVSLAHKKLSSGITWEMNESELQTKPLSCFLMLVRRESHSPPLAEQEDTFLQPGINACRMPRCLGLIIGNTILIIWKKNVSIMNVHESLKSGHLRRQVTLFLAESESTEGKLCAHRARMKDGHQPKGREKKEKKAALSGIAQDIEVVLETGNKK